MPGDDRARLYALLAAAAALLFAVVLAGGLAPLGAGLLWAAFAGLAAALWPRTGRLAGQRPLVGRTLLPEPTDLRAFADALPDPCLLVDAGTRIRHQNEAAVELLGRSEIGQPLNFLLRAPEVSEAVQEVVRGAPDRVVTYAQRVPVDRWFEATVRRIGDRTGPEALFLLLLRDLTEAQRVERMRADFVANASHELRTPLASLIGFIETLQGPAREDATARERFLGIMAVQAQRMSRLVDDLMSLARIELKAHMRPSAVVDLAPVLQHVVDAMQPLARDDGVELRLVGAERPVKVVGDRDELAQVFQNLVHNAVKYGRTGGLVEIALRRHERGGSRPDAAIVSVKDHGPGIPPEHIPRLTERFYRVDVESSRERGGTGLGLAIVKHILNRHRGQLTIESELGEGAVFSVHLDVAPSGALDRTADIPQGE